MPPRSKLKTLPAKVREELDRRLVAQNFGGYIPLARWLETQGCVISSSAVRIYGSRMEQRLRAIKLATDQARAVVEASPDDDGRITEAMLQIVQQQLFAVLVELSPAEMKKINLAALARGVSQMGRAAMMHRQWKEQWRAKLAAKAADAEAKVVGAVHAAGGGLTPLAIAQIRNALLEMTGTSET
jgi:hypothetical protein